MMVSEEMLPVAGDWQVPVRSDVYDLVDDIDAVVWEADPATFAFTFVSKGAERLLGYPISSWLHEPAFWANRIHPDDRVGAVELCTTATRLGRDHEFSYRMVARDGTTRWVRDLVRVGIDDDGQVTRLRGVLFDETARRRTEETLRESEQRFRAVFESTAAGIVLASLDGRITTANEAASRMLGYGAGELRGKSVIELAHPDERALTLEVLEKVGSGNCSTISFEARYLHRDGRAVTTLVSGVKVAQPNGGESYLIAQLHDISDRKALERDLRQAHKLEAVGRLAGGVAHDFNNMLLVVMSYADMLIDDLHHDDPRRDDIVEIRTAARAAADLTRQLLAFSRQQVVEPKVVALGCVIAGLERMLRRLIRENIALEIKVADEPLHVLIDPGQLEQVIVNLAVNARDAMPEGGTLTIEAQPVKFDGATGSHFLALSGRFAMLTVTDTGVGMDEATRQKIFEPFFTTKASGKGTGLGLATVYGIAKQNAGGVTAESEPGKGARFKFFLPLMSEAPVPHPGEEPAPERGGTETILLVEDDVAVREVTRRVLERFGYRVLEAASARAAVDIAVLHGGPIALLLTDLVMPDLAGRQVADQVRILRPGTRVLYMSGYTDDAVVRHGIAEPGAAFIAKPFSAAALAAKVRQAIDGR
jgi:two-component system cell cycle sensor histidine kinase/response regulator CckA